MARTTAPHVEELLLEEARRERWRSAIPVAVAVVVLLGVLLAGCLALRGLVDFGIWLIGAG